MPYTALPDRRISYDNDGTVIGYGSQTDTAFGGGIIGYLTGTQAIELNDDDGTNIGNPPWSDVSTTGAAFPTWLFFPEQREVTAHMIGYYFSGGSSLQSNGAIYGSNDTTNGLDGTWETASLPQGMAARRISGDDQRQVDAWRSDIRAVSFTGGKRTLRMLLTGINYGFGNNGRPCLLHLYGEKVAGQTPDDVIYIDHDTTPGVEYTAPEDFGDQPLGTTVVRQFRLKNTSATKTANTINVQCNDSDFAISTDGTTWVVTINIASLGPGAQSATMYVRCTTPAPGNLLGPRFARLVTTVASYT